MFALNKSFLREGNTAQEWLRSPYAVNLVGATTILDYTGRFKRKLQAIYFLNLHHK